MGRSSAMILRPGKIQTLRMTAVDGEALGEGSAEGITIKVGGTASGDRVRVRIDHVSPHRPVAWASVVEVLERGGDFRRPPCHWAAPLRGDCGGCPALHLTESARRKMLLRHLEKTLAPLGIPDSVAFHDAPATTGYRNRANYVLERRRSGRVRLGSWAPRSHDVARMDGCLVVRPPIDAVARALSDLLTGSDVPVHPPAALGVGALRYVTVRSGQQEEALVDLVIGASDPPWLDALLDRIAGLDSVVGVATSINDSTGNALRVGPSETRRGRFTVTERVGEGDLRVDLEVAAATFTQLHTEVAGRMYRRAAEWLAAELESEDPPPGAEDASRVVWDLYCGVGGLGRSVSRALTRGARERGSIRLWGAESDSRTVELAGESAGGEAFEARFEAVDLVRGLPRGWPAPTVVLLNPPRRGLHSKVVDGLAARDRSPVRPSRLVYMSCNPESFARDTKKLLAAGWTTGFVEAHDMLPGTAHVELLAGLRRPGSG